MISVGTAFTREVWHLRVFGLRGIWSESQKCRKGRREETAKIIMTSR